MAAVLQAAAVLAFMGGGLAVMLRRRWAWRVLVCATLLALMAGFVAARPGLAVAVVLLTVLAAALAMVLWVVLLGLAQQLVKAMFGEEAAGHFAGVHVVRFVDALLGRGRR